MVKMLPENNAITFGVMQPQKKPGRYKPPGEEFQGVTPKGKPKESTADNLPLIPNSSNTP